MSGVGILVASTSTATQDVSPPIATSNLPTIEPPVFSLLELAPELRKRIFEIFFENHRVAVQCCDPDCSNAHCSNDDEDDEYHSGIGRLALTRTSKQVRNESLDAFLRVATFDFQLLDYHPGWTPNEQLRSLIVRMRNFFGPPRLLHHLRYTTLSYSNNIGEDSRWVDDCMADHVVCDMIVDQFDITDALTIEQSNEAQYFKGLKSAIAGPQGAKLTLCVQVEDNEPTWTAWDEPYVRSGFQVWKQKVIVRRKPKTEQGKQKLKAALMLMGLELMEKDKKIIEPVRNDTNNDGDVMQAGNADAIGDDDANITNIPGSNSLADSGNMTTSEDRTAECTDDSAYQWWSGARDE